MTDMHEKMSGASVFSDTFLNKITKTSLSDLMVTHVAVVDGDSLPACVFMCADVLVDAPVTPPATANTTLAPSRAHRTVF